MTKAVKGMLPKNHLRLTRMARLHLYPYEGHPFGDNISRFYYKEPEEYKVPIMKPKRHSFFDSQ